MTDRASQAESLYEQVRGCTACTLATTRTCAVPGEGPLDAEVMFIGEAPGMNEDKQGRPFVGAAGKFLDELLAAAGFRRDEVYICNVLKCRPPGNRDPLPSEIEACRGYLERQIELVDPAVIVSLGRYSMNHFFPNAKISRVHGQTREIDGRTFMPMYHPAAALHQHNLRPVLLGDFAGIPAVLASARQTRASMQDPGTPGAEAATPATPGAPAEHVEKTEQIPLFE